MFPDAGSCQPPDIAPDHHQLAQQVKNMRKEKANVDNKLSLTASRLQESLDEAKKLASEAKVLKQDVDDLKATMAATDEVAVKYLNKLRAEQKNSKALQTKLSMTEKDCKTLQAKLDLKCSEADLLKEQISRNESDLTQQIMEKNRSKQLPKHSQQITSQQDIETNVDFTRKTDPFQDHSYSKQDTEHHSDDDPDTQRTQKTSQKNEPTQKRNYPETKAKGRTSENTELTEKRDDPETKTPIDESDKERKKMREGFQGVVPVPVDIVGKVIGRGRHQANYIESCFCVKLTVEKAGNADLNNVRLQGLGEEDVVNAMNYVLDLVTCSYNEHGSCRYGRDCYFLHECSPTVLIHPSKPKGAEQQQKQGTTPPKNLLLNQRPVSQTLKNGKQNHFSQNRSPVFSKPVETNQPVLIESPPEPVLSKPLGTTNQASPTFNCSDTTSNQPSKSNDKHPSTQYGTTHGTTKGSSGKSYQIPAPSEPLEEHAARKKTRRSRKKKRKKENLTIGYTNARGIKSKLSSLQVLLEDKNIDIMVITETNMKQKQNLKINGYRWFGRPRTNKSGGGVGFLIKNSLVCNFTIEPFHDSKIEDMWIVCTLSDKSRLCIGTYYGKQETCSSQEIQEEFHQLHAQITDVMIRHDHMLLVGDFNAKVGNDHQGVTGNHSAISRNGQYLRNLVQDCNLSLLNNLPLCQGLWTRVNTKNADQKAILDYALCSNALAHQVKSMVIDDKELHKLCGSNPTDHNTILITMPSTLCNIIENPRPQWKTRDADWKAFSDALDHKLCDSNHKEFDDPTEQLAYLLFTIITTAEVVVGRTKGMPSTDPIMRTETVKQARKVKGEAKTNFQHSLQTCQEQTIKESLHEYKSAQKDLIDTINSEKAKMVEKQLEKIEKEGGVNSKAFWNIRRKAKKNNLEDMWAVKDGNGKILYNPDEVACETAKYYETLYSPRKSPNYSENWSRYVEERIDELRQCREHEDHPLNQPLTLKELKHVISTLPLNKSCGPDEIPNEFIKYGGTKLQESLFTLFSSIFHAEHPPNQWNHSNLINLDKGRGDPQLLSNKRGITLSSNLSKLFERVLNNRVRRYMKFTEAQAGGREGHSCIGQLFTLKSVINQYSHEKKATYCAFVDLEKAYDKVWPCSIFYILWKRGIRGKVWRIMEKLNSDLTTSILTKFGYTRPVTIQQSVRQGGVLSVAEFSVLIDQLEEDLKDRSLGIKFGPLLISSLLLMDDIVLLNDTPEGLQDMLDVLNDFLNRWHLQVNPGKSKVLVFSPEKHATKNSTIHWHIGDTEILQEKEYKYLGEYLTTELDLRRHLISKKQQLHMMLNLSASIAGSAPLDKISLRSLLQFHHKCIIPAILYGCQTWTSIPEEIEDLQFSSLRQYLKVPASTPKVALLGETGTYSLAGYIAKYQLNYLWNIIHAEGTLPYCVLNTQLTHFQENLTNWAAHIRKTLKKYDINYTLEEIMLTKKSKWKQIVNRKVVAEENKTFRSKAKKLSKLKQLNVNKHEIAAEQYLHLTRNEASMIFRLRTRMLPLRNNMRHSTDDISCPRCRIAPDTEVHLMEECARLEDLRIMHNITSFNEIFTTTDVTRLKAIAAFCRESLVDLSL